MNKLIIILNIIFYNQIQAFFGDATSFGGSITGGFCGFKEKSFNYESKMQVALNSEQWGNNSLNCGRCVSIQYKDNEPILALISDKCPECKYGDLDLFIEAYHKIINPISEGREKINWEFVNCPNEFVTENIKLRIDNINPYWLSIIPESFICGIIKMEILFDNEWIEMDRNDDDAGADKQNKMNGLYFIYHNFVKLPFQLKLTSMYNDIIISPKYYKIENILFTNQQFKCMQNSNQQNCKLI